MLLRVAVLPSVLGDPVTRLRNVFGGVALAYLLWHGWHAHREVTGLAVNRVQNW